MSLVQYARGSLTTNVTDEHAAAGAAAVCSMLKTTWALTWKQQASPMRSLLR
jgi:hypothetical protein